MNPVRAAGGVVWRAAGAGVEVCLVHRPRHDDWSLPKGRLERGEHPLAAAVREVAEETDVRAVPQVRLPPVRYLMRDGTPKVVDYWSMQAAGTGGFQEETEVDALRWLPVEAAVRLATYPHDAQLLRTFAALPVVTAVLALLRHGEAGQPYAQPGRPDRDRPLEPEGLAQARALAPLLALGRPERLVAAAPRRCKQTLHPLSELLDLPIEVDSTFNQPEPGQSLGARATMAAARLTALAATGPAAVCSQGGLIPAALAELTGGTPDEYLTTQGSGWLLAFAADKLVATDRLFLNSSDLA